MKLLYFIFLILFYLINNYSEAFLNLFKNKINIDINKKLTYNLCNKKMDILKRINGFYGILGPNIDIKEDTTMYDLFSGDGMIQGIFFNNGEITYSKAMIKTEKYLFEEKYGIIPKNPLIIFIFFIMNKMNKLPNIGGLANTALLNVDNKVYALYEMDYPYLLDIECNNKTINTIGKKIINNFEHFSGHSKFNEKNNLIESLEYKMDKNLVRYYELDNNFSIKKTINFNFKNIPLVHDFYSTNENIYLIDCPIEIDYEKILIKKMPLLLNKNKKTNIHVYNKIKNETNIYMYNESIFLFHYSKIIEEKDYIKIFAPIYDNIDFLDLDIYGRYRMLLINKKTSEVKIIKNVELEKYNLDFPISYDGKIVLCNRYNNTVNGFIICKDLKIIKKIIFEDRNIKGEHRVIKIDNKNYLIFFCEINSKNYISILDIQNNKNIIDIEIMEDVKFGFHSIFLNN